MLEALGVTRTFGAQVVLAAPLDDLGLSEGVAAAAAFRNTVAQLRLPSPLAKPTG
jgi:hypothetical protein